MENKSTKDQMAVTGGFYGGEPETPLKSKTN